MERRGEEREEVIAETRNNGSPKSPQLRGREGGRCGGLGEELRTVVFLLWQKKDRLFAMTSILVEQQNVIIVCSIHSVMPNISIY